MACVVKTADAQSETRQEESESHDGGDDADARLARSEDAEHEADGEVDDSHEEHEPPVFRARGTSVEVAVVLAEGLVDGLSESNLSLIHIIDVYLRQ